MSSEAPRGHIWPSRTSVKYDRNQRLLNLEFRLEAVGALETDRPSSTVELTVGSNSVRHLHRRIV